MRFFFCLSREISWNGTKYLHRNRSRGSDYESLKKDCAFARLRQYRSFRPDQTESIHPSIHQSGKKEKKIRKSGGNDAHFLVTEHLTLPLLTSEHMHRSRHCVWNWLFRIVPISREHPTLTCQRGNRKQIINQCIRNNESLRFHHVHHLERKIRIWNLQAPANEHSND